MGGQSTDLEVLAPQGVRCGDAVVRAGAETVAAVVRGAAEEGDEGFAQGIRCAEHGVDKGEADAAALVVGVHAERAEAQGGGGADMAPGADHVTNYLVLAAECHERQFWYPAVAGAEFVEENYLHRSRSLRFGEGFSGDGVHGGDIGRRFASDQHRHSLGPELRRRKGFWDRHGRRAMLVACGSVREGTGPPFLGRSGARLRPPGIGVPVTAVRYGARG